MLPKNTAETVNALRQSLEQLACWGCRGFACSESSLTTIQSWSAPISPRDSLAAIRSDLHDCRHCSLHRERRHILFGEGNPHARLMIVGPSPAEEEDRCGQFFQGPAGELLLRMIRAMKLTPEQIFITYLVKCRSSHDELTASPGPIRTCLTFLKRQIRNIQPEVICAMGESVVQNLLGRHASIETLRGRFYDGHATKIMPTLDPAYIASHPEAKGRVWEDLKMIMAYLGIAP